MYITALVIAESVLLNEGLSAVLVFPQSLYGDEKQSEFKLVDSYRLFMRL